MDLSKTTWTNQGETSSSTTLFHEKGLKFIEYGALPYLLVLYITKVMSSMGDSQC